MRDYLAFIFKFFILLLLIFVLQKVVFMLANQSYCDSFAMADALGVLWHGLRLDVVIACYLMIVPVIVCAVSQFFESVRLRKILSVYYIFSSAIIAVSFLADLVLYNFWGAKLDAADLIYAKNPKDMLASLSWWMLVLSLVVLVVLMVGQYLLFRKITPQKSAHVSRRPLFSLVLFLLLGLLFVGMRGGFQESTANPSYAYFSKNQFFNHAALNPLFNIVHSLSKGEDLANEFRYYEDEDLKGLIGDLFESNADITDSLLANPRPNILLLIWEGGGSLFLDNDTVAPSFHQLKTEGVYFSNLYANNFRTDRGLVSLLNGWLGLPTTSVMKMSGKCGALPSLAKSLSDEGYQTSFYYGGDIDFTNMRGYLYETGYERVYGGEHYSSIPVKSKWGVDDQYLLEAAVSALPSSPFFATYLTLSSHEPWEVPYHKLADEKANSFAYTDSCVSSFVCQLKQTPVWDNLLLIIVPDHGVAWAGYSPTDIEVAKIPMLWLGGAVKQPCVVDQLMNQSDIAATLLSQMNIPSSDFIFSRNVLSHTYQPQMVVHAYKNGMNVLDSNGCRRYNIVDGQVVDTKMGNENDSFPKALLQLIYSETSRL